jgi:hypothetical protein
VLLKAKRNENNPNYVRNIGGRGARGLTGSDAIGLTE